MQLSKSEVKKNQNQDKKGVLKGFFITVVIGFVLYFLMGFLKDLVGSFITYNDIVAKAGNETSSKGLWMLMNFTEAQFYASIFASIGIILGGFVAWRLDLKKSKYAGFRVCYGSNMWPWVFASQILSLIIAIFICNYTDLFNGGEYTWLPTFITVVGAPPAAMLLYGPSKRTLFTVSILGGLICCPIAFWILETIVPVLQIPNVVANVFAMAISGILVMQCCKVLPWVKKKETKEIDGLDRVSKENEVKEMYTSNWFIRRVFADFSEAQFYGNEIAGFFVLVGVMIDWILSSAMPSYASGIVPAIILSQIIGSAVGVLLYVDKYAEKGWYATYVPVVSVGPAAVLMFGGTIPVAVFAGVLGGILGAPLADVIGERLPKHLHITIANVTSMGVCTIVVAWVMKMLPWF